MACYFDVSSAVFATKQGPAATAGGLAFRRTAILRSPGGRLPLLDIRRSIVGGGGVSRFGGRLAHPAGGFRLDFCHYLRNFYIFLGKAL